MRSSPHRRGDFHVNASKQAIAHTCFGTAMLARVTTALRRFIKEREDEKAMVFRLNLLALSTSPFLEVSSVRIRLHGSDGT